MTTEQERVFLYSVRDYKGLCELYTRSNSGTSLRNALMYAMKHSERLAENARTIEDLGGYSDFTSVVKVYREIHSRTGIKTHLIAKYEDGAEVVFSEVEGREG